MGSFELESLVMKLKIFFITEIEENFEYPESYQKIVDLELVNFDLWFLMEEKQATGIYNGMKERYPNRKLIPFAKRTDNDDTACFEIGKESTIQLIHDFTTEGFEQRRGFLDFWEWFEEAIKDMVNYNREENIK